MLSGAGHCNISATLAQYTNVLTDYLPIKIPANNIKTIINF